MTSHKATTSRESKFVKKAQVEAPFDDDLNAAVDEAAGVSPEAGDRGPETPDIISPSKFILGPF
jgi:hypothetical protein